TLLRVTPSAFAAPSRSGGATATRRRGSTISYTDSQPSKTTFTVLIARGGDEHGWRTVETLRRSDRTGRNSFYVSALGRRTLAPGRYILEATPRARGLTGRTVSRGFTIIRAHASAASAAIARQSAVGQGYSTPRSAIQCNGAASAGGSAACASYRRAARISASDRARFVFEALLKHLPGNLFCEHFRGSSVPVWTAWFNLQSG
ncbi:MAG TPA: hypothetical protein VMP89_07040, partial [Solirubrobacteraceae bacterium]|nr:hypothetical protein [Solirubrobacteraceae bacterium]